MIKITKATSNEIIRIYNNKLIKAEIIDEDIKEGSFIIYESYPYVYMVKTITDDRVMLTFGSDTIGATYQKSVLLDAKAVRIIQ